MAIGCEMGSPAGVSVYRVCDEAVLKIDVEDKVRSLYDALRKLSDEDVNLLESFSASEATNKPGARYWPGPSGCVHYLKTVHRNSRDALGWLEYARGLLHEEMPGLKEGFEQLVKIWDGIEAKEAQIGVEGGYGQTLDGYWNFCSALCALKSLFPYAYPSPERWMADELSYSGLPIFGVNSGVGFKFVMVGEK